VVNELPVVKEETRQRVLAAIQSLNYTPDAAARSLRSGQTRIIGLMIPDAHNPHFWQVVSGAEDEALANGYSLLLATTGLNPEREALAFRALVRQQLDALIPLFTYPENFIDDLKALHAQRVPFVLTGAGTTLGGLEVDSLSMQYRQVAAELMQHLLALGHRRIALICGVGRGGLGRGRVSAYQDALVKAGLPLEDRYLVHCGSSLEDGYQAALQLLAHDQPPTAIVGINDLLAFGALQAVLGRGLRVPADVSLAGFDDLPQSALLSPPLTSGRVDGAAFGRQCVRLVLARLANPHLPPQNILLPAQLVIRESTGKAKVSE
jgi:DNA-binding LacI/PurR family transcriptional regulator